MDERLQLFIDDVPTAVDHDEANSKNTSVERVEHESAFFFDVNVQFDVDFTI